MSKWWYEYLEETGGEIIPMSNFRHVKKSLENIKCIDDEFFKIISNDYVIALNCENDTWRPIRVEEYLNEGWLCIQYLGENMDNSWINLSNSIIKSIYWCKKNNKTIVDDNSLEKKSILLPIEDIEFCKYSPAWQGIKVGSYLECWLENILGYVWPVKVLNNIGGRLKLAWFGSSSTTQFYKFYLDYRLRPLGWAKSNNWHYSAPTRAGINIAINNADTFVRGSPSAVSKEMGCCLTPPSHQLQEGWLLECVDPSNPANVHPACIEAVVEHYFLLRLLDTNNTFIGFLGLATILPANFSLVSGLALSGSLNWDCILKHDGFAPHADTLQSNLTYNEDEDSAFLPGCKLEVVHPYKRDQIHVATVTRCLEGSRLVWIHLDTDPDTGDFLVDPETSCDIFPVGWCEMVGHPLILPLGYGSPLSPVSVAMPFDNAEIIILLHPQCYVGPYISRSAAMELLPKQLGPGHCFPVFRELFSMLLKVSHKPTKLLQLLQLDDMMECHELMAVISVSMPRSDYSSSSMSVSAGGSRRRPPHTQTDRNVEVPTRLRALSEFCRQLALALGACPTLIRPGPAIQTPICRLHCAARLCAPAVAPTLTDSRLNAARRRRLLSRPLSVLGISYHSLRERMPPESVAAAGDNLSSNSGAENSDTDVSVLPFQEEPATISTHVTTRMCTRGLRIAFQPHVLLSRRIKKRAITHNSYLDSRHETNAKIEKKEYCESKETACAVKRETSEIDEKERILDLDSLFLDRTVEYSIDPTYLAGEIESVRLCSNPLEWSVDQVAQYVASTRDCRQLASWLAKEAVDGPALLLLTLPVLRRACGLQLGPALRLCRHVASLKRAFVEQYADKQALLAQMDI